MLDDKSMTKQELLNVMVLYFTPIPFCTDDLLDSVYL